MISGHDPNQVVSEISVLYELALSVGQTLDLHDNCDRFLKTLMARKDLAYASVWIRRKFLADSETPEDDSLVLMYANPSFRIRERTLPGKHPLLTRVADVGAFSLCESDDAFAELITEKRVQGGSYAVYPLGELGFLKLYSMRRKTAFESIELSRLRHVIEKFAISLEACIAYSSMSREIMERQRAELEARESFSRLQRVVDHLPDGVCLLNGDGHIRTANALAYEYFNVLNALSHEGRVIRLANLALSDVLTLREDGLPHEVILEEPDTCIFEIEALPMADQVSEAEWLLTLRDVTQERIEQERIQQQSRLAAVGQLAAGIGHDLNNIMTPIVGFSELLQLNPDIPDSARNELDRIIQQGERASTLVRQILDFSRKSVVQRQHLDLAPFLKEAMKLLERTLPETIRMVMEIERGDHVVEADPTQLQQVLTNLAVNARDAMSHGGEFRVRLAEVRVDEAHPAPEPGLEDGLWVRWCIADTGTGMPQKILDRIFEPFFTTKAPGKGTGLGMAQVHGIVKQHGGEIYVDSSEGEGTTFCIYLPCVEAIKEEAEVSSERPTGNGEYVLVVEDEEAVREVVVAMLEQLNYRPVAAEDGAHGLEVFNSSNYEFALVLSDAVMPEMGGLELFHALRANWPDLPFVFMSGYPAKVEEEGEIELPEDISGFVRKPASLGPLAEAVHRALSQ